MERVSDGELADILAGPIKGIMWTMAKELVELRSQSRWVKVSERLPEDGHYIAAYTRSYRRSGISEAVVERATTALNWNGSRWIVPGSDYGFAYEVTHYREFPAAPKEGENG